MKIDKFEKNRANSYDDNNFHFAPLFENLHYLIKIILKVLSPQARILCVGVGTGIEIVKLAEAFPDSKFVACDPSESMLSKCKERLEKEKILNRCELVHGSVQDIPFQEDFDAAICLLVFHHTSKDGLERKALLEDIYKRLKVRGIFIEAEISFDSFKGPVNLIMENWKNLSRLSGASDEKIDALPKLMIDHLSILSPIEIEELLIEKGFSSPVHFFQSFLIHAWYAYKVT